MGTFGGNSRGGARAEEGGLKKEEVGLREGSGWKKEGGKDCEKEEHKGET